MGGLLCWGEAKTEEKKEIHQAPRPEIEKVDIVKMKLKQARDRIKNFVASKNKDLNEIEARITEKVPAFKETGDKRQLIPLLKAKKDLLKMIDSGDVRLRLVNDKLDEVEMQKINIDTINVLDDSNKYIQEIQQTLEQKDWRRVLDEAQNKYEIEWPNDSEEIQEDPAFQEMWKELGGDTVGQKVPRKAVNVEAEKHVIAERKQVIA